jgi:hypothetical protein
MNNSIENILNDLYTLDPSLRAYEADIRALVTLLLQEKPDVRIDTNFVNNLRRKLLMQTNEVGARVARANWQLWVFRLAPLGAVAVLLFTLLPQTNYENFPVPTGGAPTTNESTMMMQTSEDASAPSLKMTAQEKQLGFIKSISLGTKSKLVFDDARWLTGKEAEDAAIRSGICTEETRNECLPNDYFIENTLYTEAYIPIATAVQVVMQTYTAETQGVVATEIPFSEFTKLINNKSLHWAKLPYYITVQNGEITFIEEVYIP